MISESTAQATNELHRLTGLTWEQLAGMAGRPRTVERHALVRGRAVATELDRNGRYRGTPCRANSEAVP